MAQIENSLVGKLSLNVNDLELFALLYWNAILAILEGRADGVCYLLEKAVEEIVLGGVPV